MMALSLRLFHKSMMTLSLAQLSWWCFYICNSLANFEQLISLPQHLAATQTHSEWKQMISFVVALKQDACVKHASMYPALNIIFAKIDILEGGPQNTNTVATRSLLSKLTIGTLLPAEISYHQGMNNDNTHWVLWNVRIYQWPTSQRRVSYPAFQVHD